MTSTTILFQDCNHPDGKLDKHIERYAPAKDFPIIILSIYLFIYLFIYLSIYLFICLFIYLFFKVFPPELLTLGNLSNVDDDATKQIALMSKNN